MNTESSTTFKEIVNNSGELDNEIVGNIISDENLTKNLTLYDDALSYVLDKFIEHIINEKLTVEMWNLSLKGNLEFYTLEYVEQMKAWSWRTSSIGRTITDKNINEILKPMLYDYSNNWLTLLQMKGIILLTYNIILNGINSYLGSRYNVPVQRTAFTDAMKKKDIEKINKQLHEEHVKTVKQYNEIKQAVLARLKENNINKYTQIKNVIKYNDEPEPIAYIYCDVLSDSEEEEEEIITSTHVE